MLEEAITSLHACANEWQFEISCKKCQVLHLGAHYQYASNHLESFAVRTISFAEDFGFLDESKLKFKSL